MTEETVRAVFFKNYSNGDLNENLMATIEQISMAIISGGTENPESLSEIVGAIILGKSRISLFSGTIAETNIYVPPIYLTYFDQIRKAMVDVMRYMRDNLETMDPWLIKRFKKEHVNSILANIEFNIEKSTENPDNVRTFNPNELKLYDKLFNVALIGILGLEGFKKYAEEYNKCAVTLRQCQKEYDILNTERYYKRILAASFGRLPAGRQAFLFDFLLPNMNCIQSNWRRVCPFYKISKILEKGHTAVMRGGCLPAGRQV